MDSKTALNTDDKPMKAGKKKASSDASAIGVTETSAIKKHSAKTEKDSPQ